MTIRQDALPESGHFALTRGHDLLGTDPMFVGETLDGGYVAYASECLEDARTVRASASAQNAWLRRVQTSPQGDIIQEVAWILPSQEPEVLTPVFESPQWAMWDRVITDADDMTIPEYNAAVEILHQFMVHGPHGRYVPFEALLAVTHDRSAREFTFYEIPHLHPALGIIDPVTLGDDPITDAWINATTYRWMRDADTRDVHFAFVDEASLMLTNTFDLTAPGTDAEREIVAIVDGTHRSKVNILRTDRSPRTMLRAFLAEVREFRSRHITK